MKRKNRHWGKFIKKELGEQWHKLSDEAKIAILSSGSLGSLLASAHALVPEVLPIIYPLLAVAGIGGGATLLARKKFREEMESSEKKLRKKKLKKIA